MKLIRFHATEDGASRFQEVDVPVNESRPSPAGGILKQSNPWPSPAVRFVELPAGLEQSWHHAPARQIVLVLSGCVEVETTDNQNGDAWPVRHSLLTILPARAIQPG
jgi:quercetin dioxygenase-like cupin family protein